jgi:hypothetical protein
MHLIQNFKVQIKPFCDGKVTTHYNRLNEFVHGNESVNGAFSQVFEGIDYISMQVDDQPRKPTQLQHWCCFILDEKKYKMRTHGVDDYQNHQSNEGYIRQTTQVHDIYNVLLP